MADTTEAEREAWRAGAGRHPEREQAVFGGGVPPAAELALEDINPLNPHLFRDDRWHDHFARLRREDPVHFNELGSAGRYWSVTKWADVRAVESDHETFSSAHGIAIGPPIDRQSSDSIQLMAFIAMDPPEHTRQRRTVQPMMAPSNLRNLEPLIRERAAAVLDSLPEGETFDWVETVSGADHADAGNALRLPAGRSAQAHPLVRRRHDAARTRWSGGVRRSTARGARRVPVVFRRALGRAAGQPG
ncbi:hypothetical protein [Candidatus Poriferisodalis sp.]|uniref:hypothetical protein n=1 Tax=Candidatus Poriferisodalis sp. TaxID=3101277 RepID=UPI003B0229F7